MFYSKVFISIFGRKSAKKLFFSFFCILFFSQLYSQVSDSVDYFPLKAGLKYHYYYSSSCPPYRINCTYSMGWNIFKDPILINEDKYYLISWLHYGMDTIKKVNNNILYHYNGIDELFYKLDATVGETR
jgi:hypothetical protein